MWLIMQQNSSVLLYVIVNDIIMDTLKSKKWSSFFI